MSNKYNQLNQKIWMEINASRLEAFACIKHETLQQKYVLLLATRVTELCNDAADLVSSGRLASAPIILRSALESHIDLICTINNTNYMDEIKLSFEKYKAKLSGQKHDKNLMKVWGKFKLANEFQTYEGLYSHLCRSAHGNIETLIRDHTVQGNISIGHGPNEADMSRLMNQTIALSVTSLIETLRFFSFTEDQLANLVIIKKSAGDEKY